MKKISCIIPFYNESIKPVYVVGSILKLNPSPQIIAIDDGSADRTAYIELKRQFPHITLKRLIKNKGKAAAVKNGLVYALGDYVLLLDGDLMEIKIQKFNKTFPKIS